MSTKAEQKERTHQSILGSAARLLREKGIGGARVADVMKGAGLTVGGFYAHFGTKEQLIDEAMRNTSRALRDRLFEKIDEKPADARAEVILKRYLSARHRDDKTEGCPLPSIVGEVGTSAPEHRGALVRDFDEFVNRLDDVAPSSRGVSARHVAMGMIALMYGGLSLARAFAGTELSDEMLRACRAFGRLALAKSA
jgi:TetR/AcrR family transcriptional repressor of nem operon